MTFTRNTLIVALFIWNDLFCNIYYYAERNMVLNRAEFERSAVSGVDSSIHSVFVSWLFYLSCKSLEHHINRQLIDLLYLRTQRIVAVFCFLVACVSSCIINYLCCGETFYIRLGDSSIQRSRSDHSGPHDYYFSPVPTILYISINYISKALGT